MASTRYLHVGIILLWVALLVLPFDSFAQSQRRKTGAALCPNNCGHCHLGPPPYPFWIEMGPLYNLISDSLKPFAPGLIGDLRLSPKSVTITLDWSQDSLELIAKRATMSEEGWVMAFGGSWSGKDSLLDAIAYNVVLEAVSPAAATGKPKKIERLSGPLMIDFSMKIRSRHPESTTPILGLDYSGELKAHYHPLSDTLVFAVTLDGEDTLIQIPVGSQLNEVDLACLNLIVLQDRFQRNMTGIFGNPLVNSYSPEKITRGVNVIFWNKPTIWTNNPNQRTRLCTALRLRFARQGLIGSKDGV